MELGDKRDGVYALIGMADLAAASAQLPRAACLFSAEAALREVLHMSRVPFRECQHQEKIAALRQQVASDHFCLAWARGRAFSWEETAAYALTDSCA